MYLFARPSTSKSYKIRFLWKIRRIMAPRCRSWVTIYTAAPYNPEYTPTRLETIERFNNLGSAANLEGFHLLAVRGRISGSRCTQNRYHTRTRDLLRNLVMLEINFVLSWICKGCPSISWILRGFHRPQTAVRSTSLDPLMNDEYFRRCIFNIGHAQQRWHPFHRLPCTLLVCIERIFFPFPGRATKTRNTFPCTKVYLRFVHDLFIPFNFPDVSIIHVEKL